MCSCVLTVSAGRSGGSTRPQSGQHAGRGSMTRSGILGKGAAVAFVPRLGPAGAGLLAAFLAVRGGRLGRGARGLLRALQPEHQLDQFVLAQAFEIGAFHDGRESASSVPRKGGARTERSASRQPRRPTPWVITQRASPAPGVLGMTQRGTALARKPYVPLQAARGTRPFSLTKMVL